MLKNCLKIVLQVMTVMVTSMAGMHVFAQVEKIEWKDKQIVRNADLKWGMAIWGWQNAMPTPDAAMEGENDSGVMINTTQQVTGGRVYQQIYLPTITRKAVFKMNLRAGAMARPFKLNALTAQIGTTDGKQPTALVTMLLLKQENIQQGWLTANYSLTEADLEKINAARKKGQALYLWVQMNGQNVAVHLDNIELTVDGTLVVPVFKTGLGGVVNNPEGGYEIVFIKPGSGESSLMYKPEQKVGTCYGFAWRPDGKGILFSSSHEAPFSRFTADLYEVDRNKFRRVTNGPSLALLKTMADAKTGQVEIELENLTNQQQGILQVYVQGARDVAMVTLGPLAKKKVVLNDVVDFGVGVPQYVVAMIGSKIFNGSFVDVKPGEKVAYAGRLTVNGRGVNATASNPSYTADGKHIVFTASNLLLTVPVEGGIGDQSIYGNPMVMSPLASPKDRRVIYSGILNNELFIVEPGKEPKKIIAETELGGGATGPVAWFPDASGFIYTTMNQMGGMDLYAYVFNGNRRMMIGHFGSEMLGQLTISPDGEYIAFTREHVLLGGMDEIQRSLWVMPTRAPAAMWQLPMKHTPVFIAWQPRQVSGQ